MISKYLIHGKSNYTENPNPMAVNFMSFKENDDERIMYS